MRSLAILCLFVAFGACRREEPAPARPPSPAGAHAAAAEAKPLPPPPAGAEVAVLAGGCFWGMEEILRDIPGVLETEVGYAAGAESVRIVFDPAKLPYQTLLERWYFKMHDPTTPNRQGNDVGPQYRSAIFVTSEAQRRTAEEVIARVDASGLWKAKVVTEVIAAGAFEPAEDFHQDYLEKNPDGYTCHYIRE